MKYSESQADCEINKISDQYAFNRYTIKAAMDDDDVAYLFECFLKHEIDLDTGKASHKALPRKAVDRSSIARFQGEASRSSQFIAENRLVKRRHSGWVGVYYETFLEEPAD
jgi:hypothetical protein